jgi:hypothetical protein
MKLIKVHHMHVVNITVKPIYKFFFFSHCANPVHCKHPTGGGQAQFTLALNTMRGPGDLAANINFFKKSK